MNLVNIKTGKKTPLSKVVGGEKYIQKLINSGLYFREDEVVKLPKDAAIDVINLVQENILKTEKTETNEQPEQKPRGRRKKQD